MAVPLQTQLFDAFLGTQEGIHSIILPDIFSSGGSQNVYIDKFGRVSQVPGYGKANSSAFTTSVGGSAAMVRALIPYRGTVGGTTTRKLIFALDDQVNEFEFWVSTDNGATAGALAGLGATGVGAVPDAAQFGDFLYLTTGKTDPAVYDGSSYMTTGLSQSPTITASESATSGNLIGNYRYKLISTIGGARQAGSAASTSVLLTNKQMSLSWTADANTSVDGYEIYRTTGTGTTYYYLTSIDGRTTVAYTDNTSDLTILENRVLEEHGDPPPQVYFCEPHKQRMWWLRTDDNPTRGYWSDPGEPESVYAQNYLDFSDSETVGDQITGALGNYEGLMVVFTEKALWTVSGTGAIIGDITDWTKTRTNAATGSVSHRSAVRVPAGSKYSDQTGQLQTTAVSSIAYFTPLGDIRLFDGDNDLIISHPVRETLATVNYAQRHKIWALNDSANNQLIWFVPTGSSGEPDTGISWNYRYGVWYVWPDCPFGHGVELDSASDAAILLTGEATTTKGGYIYTFFDGNSFDGTPIEAAWMTKTLYGVNEQGQPAMSHRKRWRWVDLLFKVTQNVSLTISWFPGDAPDTATALSMASFSPESDEIVARDSIFILATTPIVTADGSEIVVARQTVQQKVHLAANGDYLHDEGIRLKVSSINSNGPWALEAMQLAYQILKGLKRRDQ